MVADLLKGESLSKKVSRTSMSKDVRAIMCEAYAEALDAGRY